MTLNMQALQAYFGQREDLQFVSISCDPLRDTPAVLTEYARSNHADLANWTFLTGEYDRIQQIAQSFLVSVINENADGQHPDGFVEDVVPHTGPIIHSTRFILVDRAGRVLGSYQGTDAESLDLLVAAIEGQLHSTGLDYLKVLPAVNASLNGLAGLLLVAGLVFVKQGHLRRHKYAMVSAFVVSIIFLACYLTYHTLRQMNDGVGHTKWEVDGILRPIYYTILISHVCLAAAVPFLAIRTLWLGVKDDIVRHRRWARITWPIWMYVSVTGVIVYLMLYHLHPALLAS
jgi:protein SCO1/2/putative membrane protein